MKPQKLLFVIKIRFKGVQSSNLIKYWIEFFLKNIIDLDKNDFHKVYRFNLLRALTLLNVH